MVKAFEAGKLSRPCAKELTHVKPERQAEILGLMESCNDYSITFVKGLVLKTPAAKRAKLNGAKTPWTQAEQKKSDLLKRLQEAEQQQDFFSGLYRQYTTNLLKLVIYVRSLLANARVREYLEAHHAGRVEDCSTRSSAARSGSRMARQWSPERIVAAIRAWHEHDPTLRQRAPRGPGAVLRGDAILRRLAWRGPRGRIDALSMQVDATRHSGCHPGSS